VTGGAAENSTRSSAGITPEVNVTLAPWISALDAGSSVAFGNVSRPPITEPAAYAAAWTLGVTWDCG
jgi:hypothetical protein